MFINNRRQSTTCTNIQSRQVDGLCTVQLWTTTAVIHLFIYFASGNVAHVKKQKRTDKA